MGTYRQDKINSLEGFIMIILERATAPKTGVSLVKVKVYEIHARHENPRYGWQVYYTYSKQDRSDLAARLLKHGGQVMLMPVKTRWIAEDNLH